MLHPNNLVLAKLIPNLNSSFLLFVKIQSTSNNSGTKFLYSLNRFIKMVD